MCGSIMSHVSGKNGKKIKSKKMFGNSVNAACPWPLLDNTEVVRSTSFCTLDSTRAKFHSRNNMFS